MTTTTAPDPMFGVMLGGEGTGGGSLTSGNGNTISSTQMHTDRQGTSLTGEGGGKNALDKELEDVAEEIKIFIE